MRCDLALLQDADAAGKRQLEVDTRIEAITERVLGVLDGAVLCLPAACGPPPWPGATAAEKDSLRLRTLALTAPAGLAGAPCVSLPALRTPDGPVNLAIVGAPGSDEQLAALALRYTEARNAAATRTHDALEGWTG